jgi:hypothetical protein
MPDGTPDRILEKELVFEDESTEAPALELRARCMVTDTDTSCAAGQAKCSAEARMMGKGEIQTEELIQRDARENSIGTGSMMIIIFFFFLA